MESVNPKDVPDIDIYTISYITLKNGSVLIIDESAPENPNKPKKKTENFFESNTYERPKITYQISNNTNLFYKAKNLFNYSNKKPINPENSSIRTKFNGIQKISKNINFFYLGKLDLSKINNNIKSSNDNIPSNRLQNKNNNKNQDLVNDLFKLNIMEINKNKNNENNDTSNFMKSINELPKKNENKENTINRKESINEMNNTQNNNQKPKKTYKNRIEQILDDNKHSVKAVISLNIPSDIPYDKNSVQRQFNILLDQLNRKKYRTKKSQDENYKRYYELYKNKNEKVYNNKPLFNRIKYYNESNDLDYQLTTDNNNSTINNASTNFNNTFYNTGRKSNNASRLDDLKVKTHNGSSFRSSSEGRFKVKNHFETGVVLPSNYFNK